MSSSPAAAPATSALPTTSDTEDVEAHGYTDRPTDDKDREAASDEPDVEGHGFTDRPTDRPTD